MPHIKINTKEPGIISLFAYNPETARPLNNLAQVLLRGKSSLEEYERELIAAHVSSLNKCNFCYNSHAAAVDALVGNNKITLQVMDNPALAEISPKMKALLNIAARVQNGGKSVLAVDVENAKNQGATDKEIHDTVLIAAAFCMYNRYVDGLDTVSSYDKKDYVEIGEMLATRGYVSA